MLKKYAEEIKPWSIFLFFLAILAETIHFLLFGKTFFNSLMFSPESTIGLIIQWCFPLAGAAVFQMLAKSTPCNRFEYLFFGLSGLFLSAFLYFYSAEKYVLYSLIYISIIPFGIYFLYKSFYFFISSKLNEAPIPTWVSSFLWSIVAITSVGVATNAMLRVGSVIYPLTYDFHLLKIDAAFGGFSQSVAAYTNNSPFWFKSFITGVYSSLALLFFPIIAILIREKKIQTLHGWRTMMIPFGIAWVCYFWLPATGPIAVFGMNGYPENIPPLSEINSAMVSPPIAARNAVPSMHLSGAIWIFMIAAAFRRKIWFVAATVFLVATAWATLALGEHYLIDLIVAVPFAASIGLWLMSPPRWQQAPTWAKALQWTACSTFILWMGLLKFAPFWLETHLHFVQILAAWSVALGFILLALHLRIVWREVDTNEDLLCQVAPELLLNEKRVSSFLPTELHGRRWMVGIFFFSGFAGLVYEVVYAKALGVTFGGTALAANTVLMTYMGGMALGAWLGGIFAERTHQPLRLYAIFEAIIGLYAAVTPFLFSGIQSLYVALAMDSPPDAIWLTVLRMSLGAAVLGLPTILMGATLPLVFQCLRAMGMPTGRAIAPLYGANVLGAAAGALVAGYALLPAVGRNGSTLVAAVISLIVALYVIDKIKRAGGERLGQIPASLSPKGHSVVAVSGRLGLSALIVLLVGGVVTLALEVVFMHLLAVVAGNSVYAFGLMLATFLTGLGLGSSVGERLMLHVERARLIIWAQCGIALAILVTSFVWDGLAAYMGSFGYVAKHGLELGFSGRELVRAMVCALAMIPPAFFIGMNYPAAMGLAADWLGRDGAVARGVGTASGINTLGNIAGVLLAGFWWLPIFGSRNVLLGLAIVVLLLAAMMVWADQERDVTFCKVFQGCGLVRGAPVIAIAAGLTLFPSQWNYTALSQGGNVYFQPQQWGEVIDHAESVEGGMTTVARNSDGLLTLLTNGKFQGNNAEAGEMVAQESFALIPLLHTTQRKNALVIGYGTGMTTRVLQDQGFQKLDVVELSRDIVAMADKYFQNINAHISSHPSVHMHYTDGRNYLLTQNKNFDLVSLEITSIWFSGAANLYNREFYELVNKRLMPNGVLQQWVQLHHMRPIDFLYVLGSARSVFKNVWVYVSGGQGIIVASNADASINNREAIEKLSLGHTVSGLDVKNLTSTLIASPAQVDAMIKRYDRSMGFFISTDKNLYLEYATPKGNAVTVDTAPILIEMLKGNE